MEAARLEELLEAERSRGRALREQGTILRIWRLPGARANVGVWSAEKATDLHEAIASLPMFPWMRTEVAALATHPLELD